MALKCSGISEGIEHLRLSLNNIPGKWGANGPGVSFKPNDHFRFETEGFAILEACLHGTC